MQAQRFIRQTDAQGNLPPMPVLQPNCKVEIILLVLAEDKTDKKQLPVSPRIPRSGTRKPHPALAGRMVFKDDFMGPVIDEDDWEV